MHLMHVRPHEILLRPCDLWHERDQCGGKKQGERAHVGERADQDWDTKGNRNYLNAYQSNR
jgi:hypothetical protein